MDKFAKLMQDIGILWEKYRMMYLNGMLNTLGLALAATAIGCIIGLLCGILNTIPCAKNDPLPKRILLKILRVIIRIYVEVFRGTPMAAQYDADPRRFRFWEVGQYIDLFVEILRRLRPDLVVERFASEAPPRYHYGRNWGLIRNETLLAMLEKRLEERGAYQGEIFIPLCSNH